MRRIIGNGGAALALSLALWAAPAAAQDDGDGVAYGPDPQQTLEVCRPTGGGVGAALILLHGGGWDHGSRADARGLCRFFADRGLVSVAIDYRFADGGANGAWPAQLVDAQLAVRWVRAHASALGVRPDRICAYGESAGAHLATLLAVLPSTHPGDDAGLLPGVSSKIACAVDNFGPVDFTVPSPFRGALRRFFPDLDDAERFKRAAEVSPLSRVGASTAPLFVAHGDADPAVPFAQSQALVDAAKRAHAPVTFEPYAGGHSWQGLSVAERQAIRAREADFVLAAVQQRRR